MGRGYFSIVLMILFSFSGRAGTWSQECFEESFEGSPYKYCIAKGEHSTDSQLLYFFHGAAGSAKDWLGGINADSRKELNDLFDSSSEESPTVLSLSVDSLWMFGDRAAQDKPLSELSVFIEGVLMPLEKKLFANPPRSRLLMGVSMGGYNAMRLAFAIPDYWDAVVLISPLSLQCDPHSQAWKILGCLVRDKNKENLIWAYGAHVLVKSYFATPEVWGAQNPLAVAAQSFGANLPPIYISSGEKDEFGFYKGSEDFAHLMQSQLQDVTWAPTKLKHGLFNAPDLVDWIRHY